MSDTNSLTGNRHHETSGRPHHFDNHSLLLDYNKVRVLALLPVIVYIVFMIVLGTVGNSVALVVYYKRFKPSATRTFIMSLSTISLLTCLVCFPEKIAEYCLHYTFPSRSACQVFSFLRGLTTYSTGLIHVAIACDRQRRVCSPSARQWKVQDTHVAVGVCVTLSAFISIPFFVLYGSRTADGPSNVTGVMCGEDDSYVGSTGLILYYVVLNGVFVAGLVVTVVCYVKVVCKVWKHKKQLEKRYLLTPAFQHQGITTHDANFSRERVQVLAVSQTDDYVTHEDTCCTSDLDCTGRTLTSLEKNSTFTCRARVECHVTGKLAEVTSFDLVAPNPPHDCLKLVTFASPDVARLECALATVSSDLAIPVLHVTTCESPDVDTGGSNIEACTSPQVDTCQHCVILSEFPASEAYVSRVTLCTTSATYTKESREKTREGSRESRAELSFQDLDSIEPTVDRSDFTVTTSESNTQTTEPAVHRTESPVATTQSNIQTIEPTVTTTKPTVHTDEPNVATIESHIATREQCVSSTENNVVAAQPNLITTELTDSLLKPDVETCKHTFPPHTSSNAEVSETSAAESPVTTRSNATGHVRCSLCDPNTPGASVASVSQLDVRRTSEPTVKIHIAADVSRSVSVPVFLVPDVMSRELREVTRTEAELTTSPSFAGDMIAPSDQACDSLDESGGRTWRSPALDGDTPLTTMTSSLSSVIGTKPYTTSDTQPISPGSPATATSQYVGLGLEELSEGGSVETSLQHKVIGCRTGCVNCPACSQSGLRTVLCCILAPCASSSVPESLTKPSRDRRHDRRARAKRIPSRTTFTLLVMSGIFILSYLPTLVVLILRGIGNRLETSMSTGVLNLIHFCLLSHYIGFTVGPIVYSVCSVRFRQQLCYFLSGLCKKRQLREELSLKL